jgi:recombination protein RecR
MYPKTIRKLIEIFSKFPGIGQKTATRFVFYLLKQKKEDINDFSNFLKDLKEKVKFCKFCFKPFEGGKQLCEICQNPARDLTKICVVEKEQDLEAIENAQVFNGLYFVLGGPVSSISKEELQKIRVRELFERIKSPEKFGVFGNFKEIILALNPTVTGEAISIYLEKKLGKLGKKITRLGKGLPSGGELEYADEETLKSAFEGRK